MSTSGWALWLTGLPASGKTALAEALWRHLTAQGIPVVILDSDELRPILTPHPTYAAEERDFFYQALGALAALLACHGANVILAATANRRAYRDEARQAIPRFAEVWVRCPLEVCQVRDQKGLYAQASQGQIATLPGAGAPYEPPLAAEIVVDTTQQSPEEAAQVVLAALPFLAPSLPVTVAGTPTRDEDAEGGQQTL